jgi:hypothetical protein
VKRDVLAPPSAALPHLDSPNSPIALREARIRRLLKDEDLAGVREVGATLLRPADAEGWGYVGYTRGPSDETQQEVRFSPGNDNAAQVEKFFMIHEPLLASAKRSDFTHRDTIEVPFGEKVDGKDLTRFYQVNNLVFRDVPKPPPLHDDSVQFPLIEHTNAIVMTGARLANGEEVVTIFSMAELARTGALHGKMYTDSSAPVTRIALSARSPLKPADRSSTAAPDKPLIDSGLQRAVMDQLQGMSAGRITTGTICRGLISRCSGSNSDAS